VYFTNILYELVLLFEQFRFFNFATVNIHLQKKKWKLSAQKFAAHVFTNACVCQKVRFHRNLILWSSTTLQKIHLRNIVAKTLARCNVVKG